MILGGNGIIIVEGFTDESITPSIMGLNSITGDILWQKQSGSNGDNIILQEDILYRGTPGVALVQGYDIENGRLLWETRLPGAHSVWDIYSNGDGIFVYTNNNRFYTLDDQGNILNTRIETSRIYIEENGVLYIKGTLGLLAVDSQSMDELWHIELDDDFSWSPIFDNGTIYIVTSIIPMKIYSIDQYSGELNWNISQDVLSNLCILGDKIYFLSANDNGYLMAIDKNTGHEVSRFSFSPPINLNSNSAGFFITGDPEHDILAMAFGDTNQLLGIRIINP
jgi:outer membrane protein assembly factor BamB